MKGMFALTLVLAAAMMVSAAGGSAEAGILTATSGATQVAGAAVGATNSTQAVQMLAAAWGQTTTSSWDTDDDTDTGRRDARVVRDQAYTSLIDIIRLLTGPENWGEVRVVTGFREREDEYTTAW